MGAEEYVRGHFVCRTRWKGLPINLRFAEQIATMGFAKARQYLDPNANCPVCGATVYFFRHENGGCAWFDAVGKPWPIHACMESFRGTGLVKLSNNPTRKPLVLERGLSLVLKKKEKCTEVGIPLVMRLFENGKWKKTRITSQQSETSSQFSKIFRPNGKCQDCGQDIAVFRHPSGVEVLFSNFGPRWQEHLPASSIVNTSYNNLTLRRKRQIKEYRSRTRKMGSLGSVIEDQIFGNTTFEPLAPNIVKSAQTSENVAKFWQMRMIENVVKSEDEIELQLSPDNASIFTHSKSFYPKSGTPVFLFKKLRLLSWFNENTMEVESISLLGKGQSYVETHKITGEKSRKRRGKKKVETNG
jgi:ribosomal protein S27E